MAPDPVTLVGDVVLGLDLATASARCVALDTATGAVLASASSALPGPRREGSSSTQTSTYAAVALDLLAQVVHELGTASTRVRAVSVTGTSGTVVPVDATGAAIGDARLYDDTSGTDLAVAQGLPRGSMLGRLAVVSREADSSRLAALVSTADVVHAALVGTLVPSDTSHLLKACIDPVTRVWPLVDVAAAGLDPALLRPLVTPGSPLGEVAGPVVTALGLPAGVVVVAGMTDGCTAQIATGTTRLGHTVGVLGTTLVLKGVSRTPVATEDGAVYSHLSPAADWWPGGASNAGGGVLAGLLGELTAEDFGRLDARAAERGPASVVCYPLSRPGERFPVPDPGLTALWSGRPADDVDAYRAILDGVAFVERYAVERLDALGAPTRRHTLAGGAATSEVWSGIRATVLSSSPGVERVVRHSGGGSAVGAAVLAAHGLVQATEPFPVTVDRLTGPPTAAASREGERSRLDTSYAVFLDLLHSHHATTTAPHPMTTAPHPTTTAAAAAEGTIHHV